MQDICVEFFPCPDCGVDMGPTRQKCGKYKCDNAPFPYLYIDEIPDSQETQELKI